MYSSEKLSSIISTTLGLALAKLSFSQVAMVSNSGCEIGEKMLSNFSSDAKYDTLSIELCFENVFIIENGVFITNGVLLDCAYRPASIGDSGLYCKNSPPLIANTTNAANTADRILSRSSDFGYDLRGCSTIFLDMNIDRVISTTNTTTYPQKSDKN